MTPFAMPRALATATLVLVMCGACSSAGTEATASSTTASSTTASSTRSSSAGSAMPGSSTPASSPPSTTRQVLPSGQSTTGSSSAQSATTINTSTAPVTTPVTRTAVPSEPQHADGTVIASGLDVPWGIAFFPGGDALVSERDDATLLRITPDGDVTKLATVDGVTPTAEGGLLGVAVSPTYDADHLIYVYTTTANDNRVRRGTVEEFRNGADSVILDGIPGGAIHDGGRIKFGPDGMLYVSTGETGRGKLSQDKKSLGGKILRIEPDGSIPASNPFPGSPIYSYGHRNVEGMTWDAHDRMWASEFGASSWDEINRILPGHNYGWPKAEGTSADPAFTNPAAVFATSSASPSGLAYADGYLWLGALRGATVWRVTITDDGSVTNPTAIRVADARTRSIVRTPDGKLWVTTSNTDGRGQPVDDQDEIVAITP